MSVIKNLPLRDYGTSGGQDMAGRDRNLEFIDSVHVVRVRSGREIAALDQVAAGVDVRIAPVDDAVLAGKFHREFIRSAAEDGDVEGEFIPVVRIQDVSWKRNFVVILMRLSLACIVLAIVGVFDNLLALRIISSDFFR